MGHGRVQTTRRQWRRKRLSVGRRKNERRTRTLVEPPLLEGQTGMNGDKRFDRLEHVVYRQRNRLICITSQCPSYPLCCSTLSRQ